MSSPDTPTSPSEPAEIEAIELRVLTGPNLYLTRPAIKLVLDVTGLLNLHPVLAAELGQTLLPTGARPGVAGSDARLKFSGRLVAALVRRIARRFGRGVPVVHRIGPEEGQITIAFPWVRRGRAVALAEAVAQAVHSIEGLDPASDVPTALRHIVEVANSRIEAADPGERRTRNVPKIPAIAVTGTNGKTTTTRLIAHIARTAGHTVGWSNTDGIVIDGEVVEEGDWSGPGGAARVLSEPSVNFAVLETARGGILLRGVGTATNDVSVVTNISADHLGLHGIYTLDQLAEVKSTIVKITKSTGWAVLNADDDRVRRMTSVTRARPWFYSIDEDNPHLAQALDADGRVTTVLDGAIVVLRRGFDPQVLIDVTDVPLTLAGLSKVNLSNALAAASATLAIGIDAEKVREGLRTFEPDPALNPGRMNVYDLHGKTIVIDLAHNEASLDALLEVGLGLRAPGRELWTVLGTAGDRPDDAIHAMGATAAQLSNHLAIAEKEKYRRDREVGEMGALFRGGAAEGGALDVPIWPTELEATQHLTSSAATGDVIAVMCQAERLAIDDWIRSEGGKSLQAGEVRDLVLAARS